MGSLDNVWDDEPGATARDRHAAWKDKQDAVSPKSPWIKTADRKPEPGQFVVGKVPVPKRERGHNLVVAIWHPGLGEHGVGSFGIVTVKAKTTNIHAVEVTEWQPITGLE